MEYQKRCLIVRRWWRKWACSYLQLRSAYRGCRWGWACDCNCMWGVKVVEPETVALVALRDAVGVGECEVVAEAPGVGVAERGRLPDDDGLRICPCCVHVLLCVTHVDPPPLSGAHTAKGGPLTAMHA